MAESTLSPAPEFKLSLDAKIIMLTAILASLLEIIDTSIVNVAIPTMMGNLGATLEDISWVVTGYIIANAIVLPIAGWLGMQIGRRKYYVGCILLFTGTSVACGLAPNLETLIVFRVLQGLAGGALLPTSQALIQEQFPREKAGMASAIYGMGVILGPTIGPTLGGYLTDNFGWRSIFNINLPLGLIAAALAFWKLKDYKHADPAPVSPVAAETVTEKPTRAPIDVWGLVFLTLGVGCLQFVLERGEAEDWFASNIIRVTSAVAAISLPGLVWWELRTKHPILDLRLFAHSAVRNGTMLMTILGMMLYSLVFVVPVFASTIMGYTATQIGELFIPGAAMTALLMPFIGMLLRKYDPRILIFFGICFVEVALVMLTRFTVASGEKEFFWPLYVRGWGMAFLFVPINTMVLGQFSGPKLGQVAGLMNLFRQIGGSVGIAGLSTLLKINNAQNYNDLMVHASLLNPATYGSYMQALRSMNGRMATWVGFVPNSQAALKSIWGRVYRQAFVMSFNQIMWVLVACFACALIPLFLIKIKKVVNAGPIDVH
ncbi:MAG: DHA2 family efflux MFS transporter permease subunit [Bdellovibrionales bacterium]|nr:DHA2 family efflux MFS transporter permease subunit [Bdellovibrionales bacterium]